MRIPILFTAFSLLLALSAWADENFELTRKQEGVQLHAVDQPLSKVLQAIGEQSGINFSLREELNDTPVTAEIEAPDWKALVEKLLADFSKVELWNKKIAGSRIRITGIGQYVPGTAPAPAKAVSGDASRQRRASLDRSKEPRRKKRRVRPPPPPKPEEIYPDHPLAKLPDHIFMEPAIMDYLMKSKVDVPPEFKKKYGLDAYGEEEEYADSRRKIYPIPPHIYDDPAFQEYLDAVNLPKPPQFPEQEQ